jgi:TRAP-type mannitol/chloroaromatic compound transport system permease small subunit
MPAWTRVFVRWVDRINERIGRFAMYLLFVLMAVLLWSSLSGIVSRPSLWTLEAAQFVMVAYYILGGPYALQQGAHVRMDLLHARQSPVGKAWWDAFTVFALLVYLGVMIWGAIDSTVYSIRFGERSPTAWRPYLWPIKTIMLLGFVLMFLQSLSLLIRDIATIRGEELS